MNTRLRKACIFSNLKEIVIAEGPQTLNIEDTYGEVPL